MSERSLDKVQLVESALTGELFIARVRPVRGKPGVVHATAKKKIAAHDVAEQLTRAMVHRDLDSFEGRVDGQLYRLSLVPLPAPQREHAGEGRE